MKYLIIVITLTFSSLAQAQDMKGMDMSKKETSPVTYTCPMHPEIHSAKPGNCPKCGMKLVPEKPAPVKRRPTRKHDQTPTTNGDAQKKNTDMGGMKMDDMKMQKDTPKSKAADMGNMKMDNMNMPKDAAKNKSMDMGNMPMKGMENMSMPKADVGSMKTMVNHVPPHTVHYDLYIADTTVTYSGKKKRAIAVNGQIPMPTLTFTEGDTAEIYVHNNLNEETTLHWHGLFLPNQMDGVPYLTQLPIKPHTTYIYKFPIVQHGTHWYHSHSQLQEQIGMYGSFIMNKRAEWDIPTLPVVLSEWTDMKPEEVHRSLKNATDWFAIQKGTTQSYGEALLKGRVGTKLTNEWKRMNAMDVSDVYYDNFLINGKNQNEQPQFKAGDKIRLRIANGGASDYFWLTYAGGKITVVASDGNDVEPVEVDRLIIAVSETYDVVVTVPENKSYEFLVTPEDRTKSASLWLGGGEKVAASKMPKLKYFAGMKMMNEMMDMKGDMIEMQGMKMQNQEMDMNTVMYPEITGPENAKDTMKAANMPGMKMDDKKGMKMENKAAANGKPMQMNGGQHSMAGMDMENNNTDIVTLNYGMLRSLRKTTLPRGPLRELKFDLTGNMNRYVWSLDNKVVSESDNIFIRKGENVRIILYNNSMMRHPMHLHGHDFRVLNGQGENAPMKNIIDIMPMERDTIEFAASEPGGDWFFHCHILYHMMSGMGRVFSYENSPANPNLPDPAFAQRKLFADDREYHPMARVGLESNGTDGEAMLANTRWKFGTLWHLGLHDHHGYESETTIGRYFGRMQWLFPYIGFDYHYKKVLPVEEFRNIFGGDETNMFGQKSNKNDRHAVTAGVSYILPMLVVADFRVDGDGKFRFQLTREDIPLTSRLRLNFMVNTDKEYMLGGRYILTKYFSASTHYDSDMGWGAGLTITY